MGGMVLGRKSLRSTDPGCDGNQIMTGRASETFAAEHSGHTALTLEYALEHALWFDSHIEGTITGTDRKFGQLVSGIGFIAEMAGRFAFFGIEELDSMEVGNDGVC
jgi:hypothetical protein